MAYEEAGKKMFDRNETGHNLRGYDKLAFFAIRKYRDEELGLEVASAIWALSFDEGELQNEKNLRRARRLLYVEEGNMENINFILPEGELREKILSS